MVDELGWAKRSLQGPPSCSEHLSNQLGHFQPQSSTEFPLQNFAVLIYFMLRRDLQRRVDTIIISECDFPLQERKIVYIISEDVLITRNYTWHGHDLPLFGSGRKLHTNISQHIARVQKIDYILNSRFEFSYTLTPIITFIYALFLVNPNRKLVQSVTNFEISQKSLD